MTSLYAYLLLVGGLALTCGAILILSDWLGHRR